MRTAQEHRPPPARTAALAADLGGAHLGARVAHGVLGGHGDRADALAAPGVGVTLGRRLAAPDAERGIHAGQQGGRGPGVAGGGGVEAVGAEHLVRPLGELGPEQVAEGDGAPARLDDGDGLGGGQVAAPAPAEQPQRLGDGLDGAEVGTGADDDLGAELTQPADGGLEVPHGDGLVDAVGDVVGPDHDDGDVGLRPPGRGRWRAGARGRRTRRR